MQNSYYWFMKFDKLAGISFKNALRLHFDSVRLFKFDSFASALALSVIAMEELAKAYLLEDLVWHSLIDGSPIDLSWNDIQDLLHSHRKKQRVFANHVYMALERSNKKGKPVQSGFYELVHSGQLEILKQKALYVGLATKDSLNKRQRIENPLLIPQSTSKKTITMLNDYLIDIAVGVVHEYYRFDAESIESQIGKPLLRHFLQAWPHRGRVGKRAIKIHLEMKTG